MNNEADIAQNAELAPESAKSDVTAPSETVAVDAPVGGEKPLVAAAPCPETLKPDPSPGSDVMIKDPIPELREILGSLHTRIDGLETALDALANRVSFLPPQIRTMSGKIDDVAVSISEPRCKSLLNSLLGIYDLADQMLRSLPAGSGAAEEDRQRCLNVLRTQSYQMLEANGLKQIPVDGVFNPAIHRAIQGVPCADSELVGHVKEMVRPGFQTERSVLRYAEVVVWQKAPQVAAAKVADDPKSPEPAQTAPPPTPGDVASESKA